MTVAKAEVAAKIKSARVQKGWKQRQLAAAVRVEPMTVSRWERGATTPDFDALSLIAEATGRPLSYFLAEEQKPSGDPQLTAAVQRLEAAAEQIATEGARIAAALEDLRSELTRLR